MTAFRATCFDGRSAAARPATVSREGVEVVVRGAEGQVLARAPAAACRLTGPLGRSGLSLRLPGGEACEVAEDQVAAALSAFADARGPAQRLVPFLEGRWRAAFAALLGLALCAGAAVRWGIPAAARAVAFAVPRGAEEAVGRQALATLDRGLFSPSRLPPERAAALKALLGRVAGAEAPGRAAYRLELRRSPALGPNAFALPGGLVVVTDELAGLAGADRELEGVLAHEVAHGEGRHALRSVLQGAGLALLASAVLGDVTSLSTAAAALPPLLVRTGYSRAFEREADAVAGRYLMAAYGTTRPLRDLLRRLEERQKDLPVPSLLSTHPGLTERLATLERLEAGAVPPKKPAPLTPRPLAR